jgi:hypothetical protein
MKKIQGKVVGGATLGNKDKVWKTKKTPLKKGLVYIIRAPHFCFCFIFFPIFHPPLLLFFNKNKS